MKKIPLKPVEGVSNIELFYDLIFVYCISVMTSLCHHVHGDFLDLSTWLIYAFSFLVILQIWSYTTLLMNRYGDRSASDNVCLFINMFLLYFMASGVRTDWASSSFTFNLAWTLVLANLMVHWGIKRLRYSNLDETDHLIMNRTILVLAIQLIIALAAALLPTGLSEPASWVALLVGAGVWGLSSSYRKKASRFGHLAERCSLLTIIAFGETIVAISGYIEQPTTLVYPILVFALVVGLFLIYIYEHDNMLDHHKKTDGMGFMVITTWVIIIIGNLTVALEYMLMEEVAFLPKSIYLTACLVLYLLTSFLLGRYNKPEFCRSRRFIAGRIAVCIFIVAVALATNFSPLINLICDTIAIYAALWHEWLLFHGRTRLMAFGRSLGYTDDELLDAMSGTDIRTREGKKALARAAYEAETKGPSK